MVWQMLFNLDKCHVLHVSAINQAENYSFLGLEIPSVTKERELGAIITVDINSVQCTAAEQKAQKILGYIKLLLFLPEQADGALVQCPFLVPNQTGRHRPSREGASRRALPSRQQFFSPPQSYSTRYRPSKERRCIPDVVI